MKISASNIASTLVELGIPAEASHQYLVVALARVLGYLLPVPAAPVEHPAEFFQSSYGDSINGALDALNERMPVDYGVVVDLSRKVWELRYGIVHPSLDQQVWATLDKVLDKKYLGIEIDLFDPALSRLGNVIAAGVEQ